MSTTVWTNRLGAEFRCRQGTKSSSQAVVSGSHHRPGGVFVAFLSEALDDAANGTSVAALQDQDCRKANFQVAKI
jgi:hypothetical protein